ncbi:MAG: hypothetical protein JSS56_16760 [Proteobacteria bacterium]|nr:hypothetical protein [Pseudomonadota bacterium]
MSPLLIDIAGVRKQRESAGPLNEDIDVRVNWANHICCVHPQKICLPVVRTDWRRGATLQEWVA